MPFRNIGASCCAAITVALLLPVPSFATPPGTFDSSKLRSLVGVSAPTISPDGKRALVLVSRTQWNDDKSVEDVDLYDIATRAHRTLTYHREDLSDPSWSPDGSKIAFIAKANDDKESKPQIFVMPLDGGDARPITNDKGGVEGYSWRPDGEQIAFTARTPKPEKKGVEKYRDAFVFTTQPITVRGPDLPTLLFIVAASGGKPRQLHGGPQSIARGSTLSWSPDGTTLAFVLAPNAILNDVTQSHIELMDVASGKTSRLTTTPDANPYEGSPLFSPDGKHIAYVHSNGDDQINLDDVYVTAAGAGNGTNLTAPYDRQVHETFWAPDSQAIYFTCADKTQLQLVRAPLDGKPAAIDLGDINATFVGSTPAHDGGIVFIGQTAQSPAELYYLAANGKPQRISDYNAGIRALDLAQTETVTYPTGLGLTGDAVLYKPPGFTPSKTYPLVLLIHGGPTSSSATTFHSYSQILAARGWLVLEPNYRGSDNLGLAYQRAVRFDPEDGPGKDIMAAVKAVQSRGFVDSRRLAVSGWSYGGIMTAWMISKYHIWRAAISGASVNDWATDYGVADDSESDRALFHGSPFVRNGYQDEWKRASSVTYAADVTTPVLILSDIGDNRDPFATSSMYYRALHDNRKDATLVAYPVDGHFPSDPVRTADVIDRWGDFIAAHFR